MMSDLPLASQAIVVSESGIFYFLPGIYKRSLTTNY
jgi:hypothetical protein